MKLKVDGNGDVIANYSYEAGKVYERDKENNPLKVYSESATFEPQYYFNDVTLPSRDIQKAVETYFAPLGIPFDVVSPTDEATKDIGGSWRMPDNEYVDQLARKYQSELQKAQHDLEALGFGFLKSQDVVCAGRQAGG